MADSDRISDDEILLLRVPRFDHNLFQPPDHVSSGNFKLAKGESGLSVYRRSLVTETEVLARVTKGCPEDYFLISAMAGQVRSTQRVDSTIIGFDIVPDDPDGTNVGHAEIRLPATAKWTEGVAKSLQRVFKPHASK